MAAHSSQPACNHRALEVTTLFLGSTVVGLLAGVLLAALGVSAATAVASGAAGLAGTFGLGMSAVSYIKKQDD